MARHDLRQVLIAFELGIIPVHATAPRLSIPSNTLRPKQDRVESATRNTESGQCFAGTRAELRRYTSIARQHARDRGAQPSFSRWQNDNDQLRKSGLASSARLARWRSPTVRTTNRREYGSYPELVLHTRKPLHVRRETASLVSEIASPVIAVLCGVVCEIEDSARMVGQIRLRGVRQIAIEE